MRPEPHLFAIPPESAAKTIEINYSIEQLQKILMIMMLHFAQQASLSVAIFLQLTGQYLLNIKDINEDHIKQLTNLPTQARDFLLLIKQTYSQTKVSPLTKQLNLSNTVEVKSIVAEAIAKFATNAPLHIIQHTKQFKPEFIQFLNDVLIKGKRFAEDGGIYSEQYTEIALLREAKYTINERGDFIVEFDKSSILSSYLTNYQPGANYHSALEREIIKLFTQADLEIPEPIQGNWHNGFVIPAAVANKISNRHICSLKAWGLQIDMPMHAWPIFTLSFAKENYKEAVVAFYEISCQLQALNMASPFRVVSNEEFDTAHAYFQKDSVDKGYYIKFSLVPGIALDKYKNIIATLKINQQQKEFLIFKLTEVYNSNELNYFDQTKSPEENVKGILNIIDTISNKGRQIFLLKGALNLIISEPSKWDDSTVQLVISIMNKSPEQLVEEPHQILRTQIIKARATQALAIYFYSKNKYSEAAKFANDAFNYFYGILTNPDYSDLLKYDENLSDKFKVELSYRGAADASHFNPTFHATLGDRPKERIYHCIMLIIQLSKAILTDDNRYKVLRDIADKEAWFKDNFLKLVPLDEDKREYETASHKDNAAGAPAFESSHSYTARVTQQSKSGPECRALERAVGIPENSIESMEYKSSFNAWEIKCGHYDYREKIAAHLIQKFKNMKSNFNIKLVRNIPYSGEVNLVQEAVDLFNTYKGQLTSITPANTSQRPTTR